MPRITCKTPASGKPLNLAIVNLATAFQDLADPPDFSVPDLAAIYATRDPSDSNRAIRPGELFFVTPLMVRNKTGIACWVEVQLVRESGTTVFVPGRLSVPANETIAIPLQGRSLMKRVAAGSNGDRIQVRAETAAALDVWIAAEERLSAEHVG